jgi:hypothetical protein
MMPDSPAVKPVFLLSHVMRFGKTKPPWEPNHGIQYLVGQVPRTAMFDAPKAATESPSGADDPAGLTRQMAIAPSV